MAGSEEQQTPPQQLQQERLPEHLLRSWREAGGETDLELKNTFISFPDPEKSEFRQLARSSSWSGFSSTTSDVTDDSSASSSYDVALLDSSPLLTPMWADISDNTSGSDGRSAQDLKLLDAPSYGWSKGAKTHASGQCNPCIHMHMAGGCVRGEDCNFCHLEHQDVKRSRRRPCKATRIRCKKVLDDLNEKYKDDPESKHQAMMGLVGKHPYMRSLLFGMLAEQGRDAEASAIQQPAPYMPPGLQQDGSQGGGSSSLATSIGGAGEGLGRTKNRPNLVSL